ncbi:PST family polysaccharide transporter [Angulomicrobium tetraedrale]|uniref:PST family polysaccharide transporter n=1 Tax=Ancylobacter tetraedralis TaxID=217068 RepID=A0A839Z934_9HYPH|nr:lipopolysaccharide biosynthesis protein [Ancylobacter tetraedralis]MBB3771015.1 PST family polysaccharide transporter [Ancylobacter tetraedralis]
MIGHKVALGAALLTALQLVVKFVDVISLVIMARLLTPADFGLVALAASVLLIVGAVTELSVGDVLVQRKVIEPGDVDTAFTLNLLRGLLVMFIILACAFPIAALYNDHRLALLLCAMSLIPFVNSLASPAMVHFLHRLEYRPTAQLQIMGRLGGLVIAIALAYGTGSYWALIANQFVAQVISTCYSYRIAPYRPRLRLEGARSILHFAGWMTTSRIVSTVNLQSDRFLVGYILGKAQLGQYTVGSDISSMTTYAFATPIMQTMFGGFSRLHGDAERMRAAYLKGQQLLVMAVLPFGFGMSAVADRLMPLLLGPNWDAAISAVVWMAPVAALQVLYLPMLSLAMALAQPRVLVVREVANLLMRLPVTLVGAWYYGFLGAIIARTVSGFAIILMTLMLGRRFLRLSVLQQIVNAWRSLTSACIMAGAVLALKLGLPPMTGSLAQVVELGLIIAAGMLVYVATHLGLWWLAGRPDGAERFLFGMIQRRGKT